MGKGGAAFSCDWACYPYRKRYPLQELTLALVLL